MIKVTIIEFKIYQILKVWKGRSPVYRYSGSEASFLFPVPDPLPNLRLHEGQKVSYAKAVLHFSALKAFWVRSQGPYSQSPRKVTVTVIYCSFTGDLLSVELTQMALWIRPQIPYKSYSIIHLILFSFISGGWACRWIVLHYWLLWC